MPAQPHAFSFAPSKCGAESVPRKFTSIELKYYVQGPGEEDADRIQRALDLSRDKYCSVLHSLDPEIEISLSFVSDISQ